ncbi:MAG TPA: hypothetical protein VK966_00845 [Longimicrobiales bacterium]|nr:hypothetical protein [Longimicrobiales bacterium]
MSHGGARDAPEIPDLPPLDRLPSTAFPLRATLAADTPFALAGRRARLAGGPTGLGGVVDPGGADLTIAGGFLTDIASLDGVVTPLGAERRLRTPDGKVLERLVVPRTGAAWLVEWTPDTARHLTLSWSCTLPGPCSWNVLPRGLLLSTPSARALFFFSDTVTLSVEAADGGCRVTATVAADAESGVRLAVAAGPPNGLAGAVRSVARPDAVVKVLRGHAERLAADRLWLRQGREPVEALEWSKVALEAPPSAPAPVPAVVEHAMAALATGDPGPARDALRRLARAHPGDGAAAGSGSRRDGRDVAAFPTTDTAWYVRLGGVYLRWTGDLGTTRGAWPWLYRGGLAVLSALEESGLEKGALEESGQEKGPLGEGGQEKGVLEETLELLADAAEAIGESRAAERFRITKGPKGGVQEVRDGPGGSGPAPLRLGPGGQVMDATTASAVVGRVVRGLLGAEPDATRGRLVLRPRPEEHGFSAGGIMVGKAVVTLHYSRAGSRHTFRLTQERGGAPVNVVLEPALPGERLVSAMVDGQPAELDPRREGDRVVVPVQLVVDHPREVALELA